MPEQDPLLGTLAAGRALCHDLPELSVQPALIRQAAVGVCAKSPKRPELACAQSSTTILSITDVSESSTALTVP